MNRETLSDRLIKRLAKQLYDEAQDMRLYGLDPEPGANLALYLTPELVQQVLAAEYGDDWKENLLETVEPHPEFRD